MTEAILHATKGNPVPENHIAGYFTGHKNKKLRYGIFRSSQSVARGTIVLLHGRNECIEKYFETVNDLTEKRLLGRDFRHAWTGWLGATAEESSCRICEALFRLPEGHFVVSGAGGSAGHAPALLHDCPFHRRTCRPFHGTGTVQPHRAHGAQHPSFP